MNPGWLDEFPVALARIECSGERHTIRWEGGELLAPDHADPEGERALVALGGARSTCIDVLGAWSRQKESAGVLSALSRGSHDPIGTAAVGLHNVQAPMPAMGHRNQMVPGRRFRGSGSGSWVSIVGNAGPGMSAGSAGASVRPGGDTASTNEEDMALLAGLGHELTLRLVATVTVVLLERLKTSQGHGVRPALEASLFGRVVSTLRSWLAAPDLEIDLAVAGPGDSSAIGYDRIGRIRLGPPFGLGGPRLGA